MNLYQELELSPNCSQEDIKRQYRTMAHQHHPDRGGDAERFKRISLAYEVLSDPARRQEYDRTGQYHEDFTVRSEAIERLGNMINHYVPDLNSEIEDLIFKLRMDIQTATNTLENDIARCRNQINNSAVARNRLWVKKEAENFLKSFVEKLIERRETELTALVRRKKVFVLMLEILENYHFGPNEWRLAIDNTPPQ
jgi:curved DNA-binding protein CbpA